jgi:hypothetical protein
MIEHWKQMGWGRRRRRIQRYVIFKQLPFL